MVSANYSCFRTQTSFMVPNFFSAINLIITLGIRRLLKGELTLSHVIALHVEHYNSFGNDLANTLFCNAIIIQISSKNYVAIIYVFCQSPS